MTHILTLLQVQEDTLLSGLAAMQKISFRLFIRLSIDMLALTLLIRYVYFEVYKKRELFFTFYIFNLLIFLICFLLNKVDLSLGAAFGLFAVFSMLRYRTEDISIRDMSYIFLVIAMGLINSVTKIKGASDAYEYAFIAIINAVIILMAWLLESKAIFKKEAVRTILYDNLELVHSANEKLLIEDIKNRTGINVNRISITRIDFLKDAAVIKLYYFEE